MQQSAKKPRPIATLCLARSRKYFMSQTLDTSFSIPNSQPPPTSRFSTKIPRRRPAHPLWEALNPPCLSRFHAAVRPSLPNHRAGQCSSEIPPEIPMLSKPPHLHRCWLLRVVDFGCVSVLPSPNPTSIWEDVLRRGRSTLKSSLTLEQR